MLWRAPWLRGRATMILLGMWDAVCVTLVYIGTYRIRIGSWETIGNNVFVMPVAWLACSYLAGRYSPKRPNKYRLWEDLLQSSLVAFLLSAVLILHTWANGIDDAETRFRGFVIPFFIMITVLSSIPKIILGIGSRRNEVEHYILCSEEEEKAITSLNGSDIDLLRYKFIGEDEALRFLDSVSQGNKLVVVGDELIKSGDVRKQLLLLRSKGFRFLRLNDWCERYLHQIPPELVVFEWLTIDEGFALQPGRIGMRIKRMGDLLAASILLIITLPIQLIACIAIKIEDGGPVLYRQKRTGLYGSEIYIYKLRSMRVGSERTGAVWSVRNDKRITRVGAVIRKFRIDELPQLLSVMTGELSLIGPRPERPEIEESLMPVLSNYGVRYWIKPGLTGWAQVSYPYGASVEDSRQKLSYDLFYVKNAGVLMDLLIVIKTIKMLMFGKGSLAKSSQETMNR